MKPYRHDTACRLCDGTNLTTVLRLNPTPPEDMFVRKEQLSIPQPTFPLEVALCRTCGYLHLPHVLNPEMSYSEYLYESKITLGLGAHYDEYARSVTQDMRVPVGSLVVDLGSNDGTMLSGFKKQGMRVVGVEPARAIADAATAAGIPTIPSFFSEEVVNSIIAAHGRPKVVTANYMYANIDDIKAFTATVVRLLDAEGVFVVQTGYHPEQMKRMMFDYIYHEHFSYFTAKVLQRFWAKHGLQLIDVVQTTAKGGSLRLIAQHKEGGSRSVSSSVEKLLAQEEAAHLEEPQTFEKFDVAINRRKQQVLSFLSGEKKEGKRIVGYGASHSTTTLTYHFELGLLLDYLVDDNSLKHGLYSPGLHLPVYPAQKLQEDKPDYVVVLAWQYQDAILTKAEGFRNAGIKFVVPLPEFRVV